MRILAIVPSIYDTSPGQRFRIEQWEPLLRERGVEITYEPFESEELHKLLYQPANLGRKLAHVSRRFARAERPASNSLPGSFARSTRGAERYLGGQEFELVRAEREVVTLE